MRAFFSRRIVPPKRSVSVRTLVTGASRGIGRAIALELARAGYRVVINYRQRSADAEETADAIKSAGGQAMLLPFDVSDRSAAVTAIGQDIEESGPYYGVVCNAGLRCDQAFPAMTDSDWDSVIQTNLNAFYNVLKPCIMPMIRAKNGGRIVSITSTAGSIGVRGQVNYSASKAGVVGATRSLALELAKRKITVNAVAPGFINTEMTQDLDPQTVRQLIPMQRIGKPEEVSGPVAFLFSEAAAYITGQTLAVNGGVA
ncbi:3-oxoacyl-ACP reductase FabG [Myxococcota bacterium]|nr:3-oxoacyl-ACP reductase FabG [Myxococcota bacterium]